MTDEQSSKTNKRNRRALLSGAGRWCGLACLAALAGGMLARSRQGDDRCTVPAVCRMCPALQSCRLPAAESARARQQHQES